MSRHAPPSESTSVVAVQGGATPVGRRVVELLDGSDGVSSVAAVDTAALGTRPLLGPGPLDGADVLLLLGEPADRRSPQAGPDGSGRAVPDTAASRRLLDAADAAGVRAVVVLSTAMVYGAWPDNPVPLTEEAPVRPDPQVPFAVAAAELERQAADWRRRAASAGRPAAVCVLRPVVCLAAERTRWLRRSPWSCTGLLVRGAEAPVQFVHLDDVASAVDLAWRAGLDGPFNVAPDGWISADGLLGLRGPAPRLRAPAWLVRRWVAWRSGRAGSASAVGSTLHPWVVANDRLRAAGWGPTSSAEEAFVEADPPGLLRSLSPRARQELSLVALGALVAAALVGVVVLGRRRLRRSGYAQRRL